MKSIQKILPLPQVGANSPLGLFIGILRVHHSSLVKTHYSEVSCPSTGCLIHAWNHLYPGCADYIPHGCLVAGYNGPTLFLFQLLKDSIARKLVQLINMAWFRGPLTSFESLSASSGWSLPIMSFCRASGSR